jgi:hypothetical protein
MSRLRYTRVCGALLLVASLTALAACGRSASSMSPAMNPALRADVHRVATMRVTFAHQSVGVNILAGVADLAREAGAPLRIVETREWPAAGPGIFHFAVGANGDPAGKIADFLRAVEPHLDTLDVVVLKLCFADFDQDIDAAALADRYVAALDGLQAAHPRTRVIAATAPLTVLQTGPKAWIKTLLGRHPGGHDGNVRRHTFNEIVRARVPARRLYDIARLESAVGGNVATFDAGGRTIEALHPALSSDGAHLGPLGERLLAAAFVALLAEP